MNPGYRATKHLDIITNTTMSYFSRNAESNISIIDALFRKTDTYEMILRDIDERQRSVVTGEEDNRWPEEFENPDDLL